MFLEIRYGFVAASSEGEGLVTLDYQTGAVRWTAKTRSGRATILVESDVIVCAKGGHVDCFDHQGVKRWSQPLYGFEAGLIALGFPGNVAQADDR